MQQPTEIQQPQVESESLAEDTAATAANTKYPVLNVDPDKQVNIGADTTQVDLSGAQIAQHFTATVENRDENDNDSDQKDNTHQQTIDSKGNISLTTINPHKNFSSPGNSTNVTGHQVAHVSFEHEIDFSHNFSMSGDLGAGSKETGGADSVGFVFAPGDPSAATKGGSGGQLGLGGLDNAFGFVFDEYYNGNFNDPSRSPYVGWRTTDGSGNLQSVSSSQDWKAASQIDLDHAATATNDFTMNYDATTKTLTVVLKGYSFQKTISDTSTGYSISVSASTGGSSNDYSARIESFSYTPKTIPLTINLVDNAEGGALLNKTQANVVANIGDTISVFSTQAAADRAVAEGIVTNPALVALLPTDSSGNVYVIDKAPVDGNEGTAKSFGDTKLADSTYYTYTVTDKDNQSMTVPVRLAFTAIVTPIDSSTQKAIPGLDPVSVVAVAGEPVLVQIAGYTPTSVILAAPTDGQKTANDNLLIDQTTIATDTQTTQTTANALGHYYSASGQTVDGKTVTGAATVGTGQNIATGLTNGQNTASDTSATAIGKDNYYWSNVGNAAATDSTTEGQRQATQSVLVPTKVTLDAYNQQAVTYQDQAETYKKQAQDLFDKFIAIGGLTAEQKKSAQDSLDALIATYTQASEKNQAAQQAFADAENSTDDATIYSKGQLGYANLQAVKNLLVQFSTDLTTLKASDDKTASSLATLSSQTIEFGGTIGPVTADLGEGFGSQYGSQTIKMPDGTIIFVNQDDSTDQTANPTAVGKYFINLTEAGRTYLKNLDPSQTNANIGLFLSGALTIKAKETQATLKDVSVTYGDTPVVQGNFGQGGVDQALETGDYEILDSDYNDVTGQRLQVGQKYTIQYTATKQASLEKSTTNYVYASTDSSKPSFGTAKLKVVPKDITVTAQNIGITYGDSNPELGLTTDAQGELLQGDSLEDLHVTLTRNGGDEAGTYQITGTQDPSVTSNYYVVTVNPGTFNIAKKRVTVVVNPQTKVFGDEKDPDLTFTVANDSDETISVPDLGVTLARDAGENVGSYAIGLDPNAKTNSNYDVTVKTSKLTITPAKATITVKPTTSTYGDIPVLTGISNVTEQGPITTDAFEFVNADGIGVAPADLQAGEYTLQLTPKALKDLNPNYTFSLVNDKFTVKPRQITVQVTNQVKAAGDDDPANTVTLTSGSLKEGDALTTEGLKLKYSRSENEAVGTYSIDAKAANPNYDVTVLPGTLTILGVTVDKQGNKTTTQKDVDGNVTQITKQWADKSATVYSFDPKTRQVTISEQVKGRPDKTQTSALPVKQVVFQDGNDTFTEVDVTDPNNPHITHYRVNPSSASDQPTKLQTPVTTDGNTVDLAKLVGDNPLLTDMPRAVARNGKKIVGHVSLAPVIKSVRPGRTSRAKQLATEQRRLHLTKARSDVHAQNLAVTRQAGQLRQQQVHFDQLADQGLLRGPSTLTDTQLGKQERTQKAGQTSLPQTSESQVNGWQLLGLTLLGWLCLPFRRKHPME